MNKALDLLLQPSIVGALGALGAVYLFNQNSSTNTTFPIIGSINTVLGVGLITGGASLISNISKDFILTKLPNNSQYSSLETKLITPVVSGLLTTGAFYSSLPDNKALLNAFLLGSLSNMGGSYLYDTVTPYILPQ